MAIFALFKLKLLKITEVLISLGVFWDRTLLSYGASCYKDISTQSILD